MPIINSMSPTPSFIVFTILTIQWDSVIKAYLYAPVGIYKRWQIGFEPRAKIWQTFLWLLFPCQPAYNMKANNVKRKIL